jgi:hypothetical protein
MTNKELVKELTTGALDHRLNTPCTEAMKREVAALAQAKGLREADVVRQAVAQWIKEAKRKR